MTKIVQAQAIEGLAPGTRIKANHVEYIRMEDSSSNHLHGCVFHAATGGYFHWARIFHWNDYVEVVEEPT